MQKLRWLVGVMCALLATPTYSNAQVKDEAGNFLYDVLMPIFGPNWNLFGYGGWTTTGRFALQNPAGGQRALESETGFNVGGGAGVDVLLRLGLRASYSFSQSILVFRTDNGDGSDALDIKHAARLQNHMAVFEIVKYMAPSAVTITPYASAGILGSWWVLDTGSAFITAPDTRTQFGWGAVATIGLQTRVSGHLGLRFEVATASTRNPFTGRSSLTAQGGSTIEEPTRVNKTDWRVAGVYYFHKPILPKG